MEPLARVRLEQIVGRAHLEGAHRIFSVGRGDDDVGQSNALVVGKFRHHIEAVLRRHADIKKEQIGLFRLHQSNDFGRRRRLSYNLNVWFLAQQYAQLLACQGFIVGDNRLYDHRSSSAREGVNWVQETPGDGYG